MRMKQSYVLGNAFGLPIIFSVTVTFPSVTSVPAASTLCKQFWSYFHFQPMLPLGRLGVGQGDEFIHLGTSFYWVLVYGYIPHTSHNSLGCSTRLCQSPASTLASYRSASSPLNFGNTCELHSFFLEMHQLEAHMPYKVKVMFLYFCSLFFLTFPKIGRPLGPLVLAAHSGNESPVLFLGHNSWLRVAASQLTVLLFPPSRIMDSLLEAATIGEGGRRCFFGRACA